LVDFRKFGNIFIDQISLSFVLHKENYKNIPRMIDFCQNLNVDTVYFHNINNFEDEGYQSLCISDLEVRKFMDDLEKKNDYDINIFLPALIEEKNTFCPVVFNDVCFSYKGEMSPCCHIFDFSYGNIDYKGDDWDKNSKLQNIRNQFLNKSFLHPNCKSCHRRFSFYNFFDKENKKWSINHSFIQKNLKIYSRKIKGILGL
jgi:radical SAM protein with 4Fe4S-binding SPASM domain